MASTGTPAPHFLFSTAPAEDISKAINEAMTPSGVMPPPPVPTTNSTPTMPRTAPTAIHEVGRRYGLSEGEFDVLAALRRQGRPFELAPGELARHTMVTTGAITKRLDALEQPGSAQ